MTSAAGAPGSGVLTAVCVVHDLLPEPSGPQGRTAIDKRAVSGRVEVGELGLRDDVQCNPKHHGGPDQALYAYADEEAAAWAAELGREITPGLFGENLRISGTAVSGAVIGERWRIGGPGGVLLVVTAPRIPCATFQRRMGERAWVRRFTAAGRLGAYLAVLEPGTLGAGDPVVCEHRPAHGVRVADVHGPDDAAAAIGRLLAADGQDGFALTPKMRAWAGKRARG